MVTGIENLEDLRIRLTNERKKRRHPLGLSGLFNSIPKNPADGNKSDCVDSKLKLLKSQEPDSDNLFFRLAIIDYELGDVARSIVYSERFLREVDDNKKTMFRDGFKDKSVILAEGKLAMADLLTQLYLLCVSLGWDFGELRELGAKHFEERQEDFKRDEWGELR